MQNVVAAQEISLEALELLRALLRRDYEEAQFLAHRMAGEATRHQHLPVADAAERIEGLLEAGRPDSLELRTALRFLAASVDTMQVIALHRAGRIL